MAKTEAHENAFNKTLWYQYDHLDSTEKLSGWLAQVVHSGIIQVKGIKLTDLLERNSEQDADMPELTISDQPELFVKKILMSQADMVSVTGFYQDAPVVLGIDFRKKMIFLTVRKKKSADISGLERELNL